MIGDGPEFNKALRIAGKNIELLGYQHTEVMAEYMGRARAFLFAAEEDFGILPVEAQACGTPVIAYGKGGALETVIENETGVFFYDQSESGIIKAVENFEKISHTFNIKKIRKNSERFSVDRFQREYKVFVDTAYSLFSARYAKSKVRRREDLSYLLEVIRKKHGLRYRSNLS